MKPKVELAAHEPAGRLFFGAAHSAQDKFEGESSKPLKHEQAEVKWL